MPNSAQTVRLQGMHSSKISNVYMSFHVNAYASRVVLNIFGRFFLISLSDTRTLIHPICTSIAQCFLALIYSNLSIAFNYIVCHLEHKSVVLGL